MLNRFPIFLFAATIAVSATAVDSKNFIKGIESQYKIESAGGVKPHDDNSIADVYADTDEGAFTMPYCPPSEASCLPGYFFFPYDKTTVTQESLADGSTRTTLVVDDGGARTFTWTDAKGTITFHNPYYNIGGKQTAVDHVLKKIVR